jgi:ketol-acid reductoisomerase
MEETLVDLAAEQLLAPALGAVTRAFVTVLLEKGVPIEAIITELVLSGETERTYRLVRLEGGAVQMDHHSPTSQYGQLTRADRFSGFDFAGTMRTILDDVASGRFADEWDAERDAGYPKLTALKREYASPETLAFERDLRSKLGELVKK